MKLCTYEGCARPHHARGRCQTHYMRMQRGSAATGPFRPYVTRVSTRAAALEQAASHVESCGLLKGWVVRVLADGIRALKERKP